LIKVGFNLFIVKERFQIVVEHMMKCKLNILNNQMKSKKQDLVIALIKEFDLFHDYENESCIHGLSIHLN
jgi:hypothetical protein